MNRFFSLENLGSDARYALRQLSKSPGITFIAVMTLALGIGANTAVFTLTWAVILKSLPVPHPGALVEYEMTNGESMVGLSGPEYKALRQRQQACADLLAWASDSAAVRQDGAAEKLANIQMLSGNAFQVLEMQPHLGNLFSERADTEEGAEGIPVVLSFDYWQEQFHGDAGALGRTLIVDDHPVTVIGVAPKTFEGLTANFHPALYLPLSFVDLLYGKNYRNNPGHFPYFVLGRLKPGMTLAAAGAEIKAIEPAIRREADPTGIYMNQFFKLFRLRVQPGRSGVSWVKATYTKPLLVLEMLVVFLLLLCCLNTALVMLARVSGRQQEYAVRSALGAGRFQLVWQVLLETALLAVPGFMGGLLLGWAAAHALVAMLGANGGASSMDVQPNAIILGFNVGLSLLVAFGAGLWPGLRAAKAAPAIDLKVQDRSVAARPMSGWVVSLQVAISVSLLTSAVLLSGLLRNLLTEHSGFHAQGTAVALIGFPPAKQQPAETAAMIRELLQAVQQKPGVTATGITDIRPLSEFAGASREFAIDAHGNVRSDAHIFYVQVSPDYFPAIGTRLLTGNSETSTAENSMPQCVLSRNLAAIFFPGESAIGRIVYASTPGRPDGAYLDPKDGCRVVGVAENARLISLRTPPPPTMYNVISPFEPGGSFFSGSPIHVVVHATSDALAIAALHDAVQQALPASVEVKYKTLLQLEADDLNRERMLMSMSGVFAFLALLLMALGLYGLLMRNVVLRTKEIGIRVALGAQRGQIVTAIARRTLMEIGAGLLAGAAITILLIRGIHQILEEPQPPTTWPYLISAGAILLVAGIAVYFPARHAATVDPMHALRAE